MTSLRPRFLIQPGLHGSGPAHWQSWLAWRHADARRVEVPNWHDPQLEVWAQALDRAVSEGDGTPWVLVAHSFGCLAAAYWAATHATDRVCAALLVAPANPRRFGVDPGVLDLPLPFAATVVTSRNDPWFAEAGARDLATRWGAATWDAGEAGHINVESGHGAWRDGEALALALRAAAATWQERPWPSSRAAQWNSKRL